MKKKAHRKGVELEKYADETQLHYLNAVRNEIERRGITRYRISKDTGISQTALWRFWKAGGTIGTPSLCVLLEYLGIQFMGRDGKPLPFKRAGS